MLGLAAAPHCARLAGAHLVALLVTGTAVAAVSDVTVWKLLVLLSPLIAWGLYMKYSGWRERRRKLAAQQQRFLEDLRNGKA
jgi:hypothetical protein